MRLLRASVIAAALAAGAIALLIWLESPFVTLVLFAVYVAVPSAVAVGMAQMLRPDGRSRSMIAGLLGFGIIVGGSAVLYAISGPEDKSNDPDCDGFCYSLAGGWFLMFFFASFFGVIAALVSSIGAAFLPRRPAAGGGPTIAV